MEGGCSHVRMLYVHTPHPPCMRQGIHACMHACTHAGNHVVPKWHEAEEGWSGEAGGSAHLPPGAGGGHMPPPSCPAWTPQVLGQHGRCSTAPARPPACRLRPRVAYLTCRPARRSGGSGHSPPLLGHVPRQSPALNGGRGLCCLHRSAKLPSARPAASRLWAGARGLCRRSTAGDLGEDRGEGAGLDLECCGGGGGSRRPGWDCSA